MSEVDAPKKKRRSSAEVAAEKAAKELAKQAAASIQPVEETTWVENKPARSPSRASPKPEVRVTAPGLPEPTGELMVDSVIRVFSFLAKSKVSPCMYAEAFELMNMCMDFKKEYDLSDAKFLDFLHAFEDANKKR